MEVKVGDKVQAGSVLFTDKNNPEICFASPVSGVVEDVVRAERRRITHVIVKADSSIDYKKIEVKNSTKEEVVATLLSSGVWPYIKQRPYNVIADSKQLPKAIYISCFNSAPLAEDYQFTLKDEVENIQVAINNLSKVAKVYVGLNGKLSNDIFKGLKNCEINSFEGPHPAGNAGVQISHVCPVNKGEIVWVINPSDLAIIGKVFSKGVYDASKTVALTGSKLVNKGYAKLINGAKLDKLVQLEEGEVRLISGNVLTGSKIAKDEFICFYDNQITAIPEGNYYDFSLYYDKYGNPLEEENVEEQQVNIERDNVSPVDENSLKIVEENKEKSSQNVEKTESFEGPSTIVEDSMIDENATKNITESKQEDDIKQETNSDQESIASEDAVLKDEQQDEEDPVYYDAKGNVVEFAQFYDENGWFKEFPKVYDAQGNYYDFSLYYDKYGNLLEEYQTMENLGNVSTSNQLEDKSENVMRENVADLKDDDTSGTKSKKATSKKSDNKTSKKSNKTKKSNENVKKDLVESDSENKEPIKKRKMNKISQDSEEGETSGIKPAGVNAVSDLKSKSQNTKVRKSKKETTAKEGDVNVENVVNDSKPSVDENKEVKKSNARKSTSSRKSKNVEQNSDLKTEDPKADATQDIVNNEMEEKSENKKSTKRASKKVETTNVGDADELVSKPKEEIQITKTELKAQISQTLKGLKEINPGSTNLNQLKGIIKTLKAQSAQAKKIGLSEKEQQRINKSLAELLRAMANKK